MVGLFCGCPGDKIDDLFESRLIGFGLRSLSLRLFFEPLLEALLLGDPAFGEVLLLCLLGVLFFSSERNLFGSSSSQEETLSDSPVY